jgi:hypothetical protein
MASIELSARELRLVDAALRAYRDDFGHDQAELLRELKALIAKLAAPLPSGRPDPDHSPSAVTEL